MRKRSCALVLLAGLLIPSLLFAQTDTKSVLDLVKANAKQLHLSATDRDNMVISSFHTDKSGITYVYVQQAYRQINVRNSILSLAFKNGQLIYSSGLFVQNIETKALQSSPSVTAIDAAGKAAQILKLTGFTTPQILQDKMADSKKMILSAAGVARNNIEAELVWVRAENKKTVKLAWNINIDVAGSSDWWNVRINAADGSFISKDNWTVKERHSAVSDHQPVYTPLV
ncbi:MAG: hypothetical protein JSU05_13725, partial [Bacteroidetes bacterium]|nr:hypothetical protein [Bacteroidota bacterium]